MISIVIPLYNKENQIVRTLQSIFTQTYPNYEIIIINDGSTDNSAVEVEKIADMHIRLIHQENAGVSAARNRGIAEAQYELITFLDADDEWKPTYLETQYALHKKYPECSVYACNYDFRDSYGKITRTIIRKLPFEGTDGILTNYFEVASCSHPPLWTSGIMVKKEAIQSIGNFPTGVKSGEDLLTWAKLAVHYSIAYTTSMHATYVFDILDFNRNPRKPEEVDIVGKDLIQLFRSHPQIPFLQKYISFWFTIRASVYMRFSSRKNIYSEIYKAIKLNPKKIKLWVFLLIGILPLKMRIKLLK